MGKEETMLVREGSAATWQGPEPTELAGRPGVRYWARGAFPSTGVPGVDAALAGFPVAVFLPPGRPPHDTPLVLALQGMAAPFQMNDFIVPTLLDMGIACALFDTPLAGERSVVRTFRADVVEELSGLVRQGARLVPELLAGILEAVAQNLREVRCFLAERHGLTDERVALFGVSLGALLTALAFARDGLGQRLLGAIGHADLPAFARSYEPRWLGLVPIGGLFGLEVLAAKLGWTRTAARLGLLCVLSAAAMPAFGMEDCDPQAFAERVGADRRVRFLVGADDSFVRPEDARRCAARFANGECYVVPGLGHGGDGFVEHVRNYLGTQLGDWRG